MKMSMKTPMWFSKAYKIWQPEGIMNCAEVLARKKSHLWRPYPRGHERRGAGWRWAATVGKIALRVRLERRSDRTIISPSPARHWLMLRCPPASQPASRLPEALICMSIHKPKGVYRLSKPLRCAGKSLLARLRPDSYYPIWLAQNYWQKISNIRVRH